MEKLKASGLTKSIGVSNFLPNHLEAILKTATIPPACNQIEFHPYLQRDSLLAAHKKHNIATVAYGPLTAATKAKPGPLDEVLSQLAKKYAVSEAEVSLRWCIDQGVVAITTSGKEQRLSDYLRCTRFHLTPKEVETISEVGKKKHFRGFWAKHFAEDDRT
jgi:diketogulonate reductase-like aldo/keto reductase